MLQEYATVIETEQVVVAESSGAIAGVLVLSTTPDGFLIENVAVLPEVRGRGIGRALLIHAEHEARARGHSLSSQAQARDLAGCVAALTLSRLL